MSVPNSTWEVESTSVVHMMVTLDRVMLLKEMSVAWGVGEGVRATVGAGGEVEVWVAPDVGVDVAGAGWARLICSGSVLALAAISTTSAHTSTRRPSTERSECHCRPRHVYSDHSAR